MSISVVICTRNRPNVIGQAIESVCQCDYSDFDVHIMDQSTNDQTGVIVQDLAKRYGDKCKVHYHFLEKAGLSRAFNAFMRVSSGEIIAKTDDDVIVPPNWLSQIDREFASDPQAGLLYGQVLIPASLQSAAEKEIIVPSLPFERRERFIKGGSFKVFGMGANTAMRRSAVSRVGGFDEVLGAGGPLPGADDFDFAYRIYQAGLAILVVPEVKVDHYGMRTLEQWPATMAAYGIGDGAFYAKHVRCGDTFALYLFGKVLAISAARHLKSLLLKRRLKEDAYTPNLLRGVQMASKFGIDRKFRLYQDSATATMTVTQSNLLSGAHENGGG
jgi:GT2 family glycosyltransferase